ncbi:MAG: hypothetical protein QM811_28325 [Pirellulales bacterium]
MHRQYAQDAVDRLEQTWTEKQPDVINTQNAEVRDRAIQRLERDLTRTDETLAKLPADDEVRKTLAPRVAAVRKNLAAVGMVGETGETLRRLNDSWELDRRDTDGWQAETADVTFDRYQKESSALRSRRSARRKRSLISKRRRNG